MAQLRHDYQKFSALNTQVVVMVPNGPKMIAKHINENKTPYLILSDKGARVAEQYALNPKWAVILSAFKPAVFLVDKMGKIGYTNYLTSYIQEPDNNEPLAVLAQWAR